jgi:non-specific serine/threonine protein kinase/serine/threonine-protein kinase
MTPSDWQRVKEAFQTMLGLASEERANFLKSFKKTEPHLFDELESLLHHHDEPQSFLEDPDLLTTHLLQEEDLNLWLNREIGPYRVISKLGQGGMGSVYRAIRVDDHYLKNVAIKVVRTGFATKPYLRRFKSERQILASLNHPNIAHLLDGGTTEEGLPYLVMEFIEGKPIDDYCDQHNLHTSQRLRLFLRVCAAVEYAHQNLVIHRDLKPANILVTNDGTPKLLDFGIAKLLDPELYFQTAEADGTMARAMTPEYASPEQVRGDPITTASDVYSLGVVLYRLLTGHPPYVLSGANPIGWAQTILETEPTRPSEVIDRPAEINEPDGRARQVTPEEIAHSRDGRPAALRRRLRGDLDNIVLMALRKDPARRYGSVEQLANDIRRALDGQPILARPDTIFYRTGKFAKRHRIPLAAVALILISLTIGIVVAVRQARIAEIQRMLAEQRFNDIRSVSHDLIFDVHDSIQHLAGATSARKLIVQDALRYLNVLSKDSPENIPLQAEIATAYEKIGDVQGGPGEANLGDTSGALESYNKALSIRKAIFADNPSDPAARDGLSRSYIRIGQILQDMGRYQEALQYHQNQLDLTKGLAASLPSDPKAQARLASSYDGMGDILSSLNKWDASLQNYEASAGIYKTLAEKYPQHHIYRGNWALQQKKMGGVFEARGEFTHALQKYRSALAIDEELASISPEDASAQRDVAIDYSSLGDAISKSGDNITAIHDYQRALAIDRRLSAADPKDASARFYLVYDLYRLGDGQLKMANIHGAIATYHLAVLKAEANSNSDPENTMMRSELARVYSKLARAHVAAASNASLADDKKNNLAAARNWYQKSLAIWLDLRDRKALQGTDLSEVDKVTEELTRFASEKQGDA